MIHTIFPGLTIEEELLQTRLRLFGRFTLLAKRFGYIERILGIRIRNKKHVPVALCNELEKYFDKALQGTSIHQCNIDNTALLTELHQMEPFTFIPNSGNAGDMLINASTLDFFQDNALTFSVWDGSSPIRGNLVYGGGGLWVSHYETFWRKFLPIFDETARVLMLPSSFWNCPSLLEHFDDRFVVFCRERTSYEYLQKASTKAKILLDHDMAFRASGRLLLQRYTLTSKMLCAGMRMFSELSPQSLAYLMRTDEGKAALPHLESDQDLSKLFHSNGLNTDEIFFGARLLLAGVARHKAIETDRLHVAIATSLLGKPVLIHDNDYGKVSGVFAQSSTWMSTGQLSIQNRVK